MHGPLSLWFSHPVLVTCLSSHPQAQSLLRSQILLFSVLEQDTVFDDICLIFEGWIFPLKTMFPKLFKPQKKYFLHHNPVHADSSTHT